MIKPNPNYRANPKRALFVTGTINQELLDRITPEIVALQGESREPITVYIDSPGGSTRHQETLSRLLEASDQDSSGSCQLITVVTGRAASAAADLLCSGSYAIAHDGSVIFFHGVRTRSPAEEGVTVATASAMMESMRLTNDRYAMSLADKCLFRIGFRYVSLQQQFAEYRKKIGKSNLGDLDTFIAMISERLSGGATKVLQRARGRYQRYQALIAGVGRVARRSKRFNNPKRSADSEAAIIKGIVEFELSKNPDQNWTFTDGGLSQLNADFLLVNEYVNIYDSSHLRRLCDRYGLFLLQPEDQEELKQIADEKQRKIRQNEKLEPILRPVWLFFVALCYALQEGENDLSATDAFWLGLIDEVIGGPKGLFPSRLMFEYVSDPAVSDTKPAETESRKSNQSGGKAA